MESIRRAIETASGHLAEHPESAVESDAAATAVHQEGLCFRVEGPKVDLITDMSKTVGGGATAPTPGWLMRGWRPRSPLLRRRTFEVDWNGADFLDLEDFIQR